MKKYLLLVVGPRRGRLGELIPQLGESGFGVTLVADVETAITFVRSAPHLSVVALDEGVDPQECTAFIRATRAFQSGLPIFRAGLPLKPKPDYGPDVHLTGAFSVEDVQRHAAHHLRENCYPPAVVQGLQEQISHVMATSFDTRVKLGEPYIKATRALSAPISTLIYFAGDHVDGHLLLSAGESHLEELRRSLLPHSVPTGDWAADLVGEMANRMLGAFAAYFERRGVPFNMGAPVSLVGPNVALRRLAGTPSLVLPMHDGPEKLFVELNLDHFDPRKLTEATTPGELVEAGEIRFL